MRPKHSQLPQNNPVDTPKTPPNIELKMDLNEQLYNSDNNNNIKTVNNIEEEEYKENNIEIIPNNANANENTYKNILNYQLNSNSNASNDSTNNKTEDNKWTNYRICTWNLWCIPVGSPRTLSNPDRCSAYMRDLAEREHWSEYEGLIIVALQELWCWKTGIFPPFLLRLVALFEYIPYIGRFVSAFFQILSFLMGVLPILKCLPITYDPKKRFIRKLRHHLPFAIKENHIPITTFLDNGLVLMSNKQPMNWGFECYEACACDDSLANKGWLWAYFDQQKFLIINTHMQAAGAGKERLLQIRELKHWLYHKWEKRGLVNKAIILGDFNVDMESHPERIRVFKNKPPQLELITELDVQLVINGGHVIEENDDDDDDEDEVKYDSEEDENRNTDNIPPKEVTLQVPVSSPNMLINHTNSMECELIRTLSDRVIQFDEQMKDMLKGDPLTALVVDGKDSLVDNMRKLQESRRGRRPKFVKKAYINIPYHLGPEFKKLNRYEPTFKRADYNIDHVFANFEVQNLRNKLLGLGRKKMSDHRLVITEFSSLE